MKIITPLALLLMITMLHGAEGPASASDVRSQLSDWPAEVHKTSIEGARDGALQDAMYYEAPGGKPHPLLVFLHPWSGNYTYQTGIGMAQGCIKNGWSYIQPDFHGPNDRPQALGSDLVIADIANAVAYARQHGNIDPRRIYLAGASGGGHAALLAIGRLSSIFAAVSAWVPITDLVAWHAQCKDGSSAKYARDIEVACGGNLSTGSPSEKEAIQRSPLTHLGKAGALAVDLNTGIHDGHQGGSVPISHTLLAFNLLASPKDRFSDTEIEHAVKDEAIPANLLFSGSDPTYAPRKVLLRRESGDVRVTVTDGKHEIIVPAALTWLAGVDQKITQKP